MTVSFEEYRQALDNYVTHRNHTFVPFQLLFLFVKEKGKIYDKQFTC